MRKRIVPRKIPLEEKNIDKALIENGLILKKAPPEDSPCQLAEGPFN